MGCAKVRISTLSIETFEISDSLDLPQNTPAKYMMSSQQINFSAALSIRKRRDIFQPQLLLCTPEEIAGAVAFLSSRDEAYVTGETLVVSGGMQSKL